MIKITLTLLAVLLLAGCGLVPQKQVFTTENSYISTRKPSVQFNMPSDFISLGEYEYDKYQRYDSGLGGSTHTNRQYTWIKVGNDNAIKAALTTNDFKDIKTSTFWYSLKKWKPADCSGERRQINGTYFEVCALSSSDNSIHAGWQQVKNSQYSVPECSNSALIQYIPLTSDHTKLLVVYSEPASCGASLSKVDADRLIDNAVKTLGGS